MTELERIAARTGGDALKRIPLDRIQPNEGNFYGMEELEELAQSLAAVGQRQPIEVYQIPGGMYRLITGERRWRAMVLNRNVNQSAPKEILAIVRPVPSDAQEETLQIATTNQYREKTDYEKLEEVRRITRAVAEKKAQGVEVWHGVNLQTTTLRQAVTSLVGLSRSAVSKYSAMAEKLVPELVEVMRQDRLPFTVAYAASQLPEERQRHLLEQCAGRPITQDDVNEEVFLLRQEWLEQNRTDAPEEAFEDREPENCLDPGQAVQVEQEPESETMLEAEGGSSVQVEQALSYRQGKGQNAPVAYQAVQVEQERPAPAAYPEGRWFPLLPLEELPPLGRDCTVVLDTGNAGLCKYRVVYYIQNKKGYYLDDEGMITMASVVDLRRWLILPE